LLSVAVLLKAPPPARSWWLTHIILATQEAEVRRVVVQSQPRKIVYDILSQKYPMQNRGWWSGSSGITQYHQKTKKPSSVSPYILIALSLFHQPHIAFPAFC
jgi:hypothetical protein